MRGVVRGRRPAVVLRLLRPLPGGDPGRIDRRSVTLHRLMVALLVVMTVGTAVSVLVSLIVFGWAPMVASTIARRRSDKLHSYLINPENG